MASKVGKSLKNVNASQTDSVLVAGVAGKRIRVTSLVAVVGGTATAFTFSTKPAGSSSAISPLISLAANGALVLPFNKVGWFDAAAGDSLTVTTGAGSATGFLIGYELV